ncbi:MAG: VanZ family protein [Candidatus Cryptobacteroides sp.]
MKNKWIWRAALLLYFCLLAYLCFAPPQAFPSVNKWNFFIPADKLVHFLMFLPFPVLCYLAIGRNIHKSWKSVGGIVLLFIAGCVLATATELIQGITPERQPDRYDFLADAIGMFVSCLVLFVSLPSCGKSQTR